MQSRKVSRRSFLTEVTGSAVVTAGALAALGNTAGAVQTRNNPSARKGHDIFLKDSRDRDGDTVLARTPTRCSDTDRGRGSDPRGVGRRCSAAQRRAR